MNNRDIRAEQLVKRHPGDVTAPTLERTGDIVTTSQFKEASTHWAAQAEFADPFAFIDLYRSFSESKPDIMLEAKAYDVAVLQLRRDLEQFAPDLASFFGTEPRNIKVRS